MHKISIKKLLLISFGLLVTNILLTVALLRLDKSTYEHLDGKQFEPGSNDLMKSVIFGQLVSVPIISVFLGLILAIFVEREIPYSARVAKSFFMVLAIIYALFAIMGVIKVVKLL